MNRIISLALACALGLHATLVPAAPFQRYPGSHIDEHTTELANRRSTAKDGEAATKTTIYVTTDSYEKVLAWYRKFGREFVMPGGLAQPTGLPEGKKLRQTYYILDSSTSLRGSKSWVKIQNPYAGPPWKAKLADQDSPMKELTAIMHVSAK
jgi:hypothetical protein